MTADRRIGGLGKYLQQVAAVLTLAAVGHAEAAPPSYILTNLGDLVGNATIFTSHGSTGYSINSVGQVSGSSSTVLPNGNGGPVHAFLWTPDAVNGTTGRMIDLSPSSNGIDDADTVKINNFGQVLFTDGSTLPGVQRAPVLWTPATQNGTTGTTAALGQRYFRRPGIEQRGTGRRAHVSRVLLRMDAQPAQWDRGQYQSPPRHGAHAGPPRLRRRCLLERSRHQ